MKANQLRLWLASFAYVLLDALRRIGLRHSQFADATCGTIRLKLLKIGAQVRISVRRIKVAMLAAPRRPLRSSLGARQAACPHQTEYHLAYLYLKRAAALLTDPACAAPPKLGRPPPLVPKRAVDRLAASRVARHPDFAPRPHHLMGFEKSQARDVPPR